MSVLPMPSSAKAYLESILKIFLWKGNKTPQNKIHLLAWEKVCNAKSVRGAGIHNITFENKALGTKLV